MLLSVTAGLLVLVMSAGFFTGSDSSTVYAVRSSTGSGKGLDGLGEGGSRLQAGLMGIVSSVNSMEESEDTYKMAEANRAFAHYRW